MKIVSYLIAVLAAVGIIIALNMSSDSSPSESTTEATSMVSATPQIMEEAGTLTLEVPEMHCQFACFPRVQKTLQQDGTVSEVVLAEQPDPNALTVKQVVVKYEAGFDLAAALTELQGQGFSSAQQIQ